MIKLSISSRWSFCIKLKLTKIQFSISTLKSTSINTVNPHHQSSFSLPRTAPKITHHHQLPLPQFFFYDSDRVFFTISFNIIFFRESLFLSLRAHMCLIVGGLRELYELFFSSSSFLTSHFISIFYFISISHALCLL